MSTSIRTAHIDRDEQRQRQPTLHRPSMSGGTILPFAVGVLDVSVILAYVLGVLPPTWYIGVLGLKAALAVSYARRLVVTQRQTIFIAAVLIGVIPGTLTNAFPGDGVIRIFGFCAQIFLTAALIGSAGLTRYLKGVAVAISISSAIHSALCLVNVMPNHYGRFLYFGGNHPNLGAEIGVMGVLAAALTFSWRTLAVMSTAIISSILFMQGRAALLAVLLILVMKLGCFILTHTKRSPTALFGMAACALVAVAALAVAMPALFSGASDIFLLNDQYRGVGSGLVGRDSRWHAGISAFTQHPLFGVGVNYFESQGLHTPHNYFIFGLSTMGVFGFVLFFSNIILLLARLYKSDISSALILLSLSPLLVFNDRMLNMNPYPFIFYIILISFPLEKTLMEPRSKTDCLQKPPTYRRSYV